MWPLQVNLELGVARGWL